MKVSKAKRPSEEVLAKIHSLKEKKGIIAVIEPETGEYFLGKTLTEATKKARKRFPGKVFYAIRIGSSFIYEHKGGIKRI